MTRPSEKNSSAGRGSKALPVVGLVSSGVAVGLAVAASLLGHRLDAERDRSASLQSQVARLEAEKSALLVHVERQADSVRMAPRLGARTSLPPMPGAGGDPLHGAQSNAGPLPAGAAQGLADGAAHGSPGAAGLPIGPSVDRTAALHDPATRNAMRSQQLAAMHRRYPDLAQALGLSRENADRFIEMQVEQQMRKIDESLQLAASGGTKSSVEMKEAGRRMDAARRDADQALAAQFGPDVLQKWDTYQQGLGARMELRGLQLELADAGMSLTPAQRDALVVAMVREQQSSGFAGSKKMTTEARVGQGEAAYERLQAAARAVLSAEQFARFDARQRQRLQVTTAASEASRSRSASR